MDMNQYDEDFVKKYHDDAEGTNYLYEYKTGEFQGGEILGMQSIPQTCSGTTYHYDKDNGDAWIQHSQLGSFISEEYYYETDLQYPICDNC